LLQEEAIDAVASDAHDCVNRPIRMGEAHNWLAVNTDETYARSVTTLGGVFK
jgi:tyrosine-protein phosphatase YwqE